VRRDKRGEGGLALAKIEREGGGRTSPREDPYSKNIKKKNYTAAAEAETTGLLKKCRTAR